MAATLALVLLPQMAEAQDSDWVFRLLKEQRARSVAPSAPSALPEALRVEPDFQRSTIREPMPARINIPGNTIVVFIRSQQYSTYIGGRMAYFGETPLRGPITSGKLSHLTPVTDPLKGARPIEYKRIDYVSNSYPEATYYRPAGGARMPYAMFFDRAGGYALHAGEIPEWNGYPFGASHGCVRLPMAHARILFEHFSDASVRVIIVEDVAALARKWESQYIARTQ